MPVYTFCIRVKNHRGVASFWTTNLMYCKCAKRVECAQFRSTMVASDASKPAGELVGMRISILCLLQIIPPSLGGILYLAQKECYSRRNGRQIEKQKGCS